MLHTHIFRRKRNIILLLAVIAVVVALLAGGVYYQLKNQKIETSILITASANANCEQGLKKLKGMRPNLNQKQESITLLSYRAFCYKQLGQYDKALADFEQLKVYYRAIGDSERVASTAGEITYVKTLKSNPPKQYYPNPNEKRPVSDGDVQAVGKALEDDKE